MKPMKNLLLSAVILWLITSDLFAQNAVKPIPVVTEAESIADVQKSVNESGITLRSYLLHNINEV